MMMKSDSVIKNGNLDERMVMMIILFLWIQLDRLLGGEEEASQQTSQTLYLCETSIFNSFVGFVLQMNNSCAP
jgi:hypothetical protein